MRRILILAIMIINGEIFSQGFDWQYSFRLPYKIPDKFIGFNLNYSINKNTGNFEFMEDYIPCCKYNSGNGYSLNFGIAYENWINPLGALTININYSTTNSSFNQTIQIPRSDGINDYYSIYKYEMDEKRTNLNLLAKYKHRLFKSHLSANLGVDVMYFLGSNATHTEEIIAPETETFINQTRKRIIKKGIYGDYNKFGLSLVLGLCYDYSIYRGYYASISSAIHIPITKIIQNQDWKEWKFVFSITILKSID